ncbi:hypothetical protein [Aurantiacibacter marinus]|uniref:Uncharacterized protein n=1 Tax=Aurantiacibacter marinus TaxID=874156 RepID=A0A0H0XW07_9SPHN|nr:hypothetical protein [Aurantiacibacter marinus]KLI64465.1 hypothetical protein AAV99_02380 [Aurantiacibacter marinus]
MSEKNIRRGFVLAGLSNILGVLICSRLFTNDVMMETQPGVMGLFGLVCIVLWGLAYIAVSRNFAHVRWLVAVFVIEKLAYVIAWIAFQTSGSLAAVFQQDALAGVFYTIYGPNDFAFMLFFGFVFLKTRSGTPSLPGSV